MSDHEIRVGAQVREAMNTMFAAFVAEAMNYLKPDGGERILTTKVEVRPLADGSAPYKITLTMCEEIPNQGFSRVVYQTTLQGYF